MAGLTPDEVTARFRIIVAIWGAMAAGVTVFSVAVFALSRLPADGASRAPALDANIAGLVLAGVVAALAGGLAFRRAARVRRGDAADATLSAYQTHILVATALLEGPGLLGVAVCFLAAQGGWALGVGGVTVFAMVLARPRREELDRLLR